MHPLAGCDRRSVPRLADLPDRRPWCAVCETGREAAPGSLLCEFHQADYRRWRARERQARHRGKPASPYTPAPHPGRLAGLDPDTLSELYRLGVRVTARRDMLLDAAGQRGVPDRYLAGLGTKLADDLGPLLDLVMRVAESRTTPGP